MNYSLKTMLIFVTCLAILLAGAREFFKMRSSASYHEYFISFSPPGLFDGEQPVPLTPGVVRHNLSGLTHNLPGLTEHLNSAACVNRMRHALKQYPVSREWTVENLAFSARSFSDSVPSQMYVECRLLVPGYREWNFAGTHQSGIDLQSLPKFEEKIQQFIIDEIDSFQRNLSTDN